MDLKVANNSLDGTQPRSIIVLFIQNNPEFKNKLKHASSSDSVKFIFDTVCGPWSATKNYFHEYLTLIKS